MEDRVGDARGLGFEGFEDQKEALFIGCDKGRKHGYFLERLVVFYGGYFEGADEGGETFGAESQRFLFDKC